MAVFAQRYRAAFESYLDTRAERELGAAYELGRSAVGEGLGILDLADAHHEALQQVLDANGRPEHEVAAAAADFFRESLATFEVALRGYAEAAETARLEHKHARSQQMLAEASLAINATLSQEEILSVAVEQARRILNARFAEAEVRLQRDTDAGAPSRSGADHANPRVLRAVAPTGSESEANGAPRVEAPLVGRGGRRLGTLSAVAPDGPGSGVQEPMLIQLAQIASVAMENAQRYARERQIASTLQRSLLPPGLPDIPGLEIAARFWPAGDGIQVGGDFYDVFPTGAGDWGIVIGDVCGKGPDAAALTALTRYTIRAAVLHEHQPSRVLALLNAAMLDQRRDGRFATVLYIRVIMGARGARLIAASGGHPLPLLLRPNGRVDAVGAGGTLLGIVPEPALADAEVELGPGDTLLLYTDGVIEVRAGGKELFGSDDLSALLAESAGVDPDGLLDRIEDRVLRRSGGRPQDDVALLGVRVRP